MDEDNEEPRRVVISSEYFERDKKYGNNKAHTLQFGDCLNESLLKRYEFETKFTEEIEPVLEELFLQWSISLRRNFNIAVVGQESSYRLLSKAKHGIKGLFPSRRLIHGFDGCSLAVFKKDVMNDQNEEDFFEKARKDKCKSIVLMSSYDYLYRRNPEVVDYIWRLYEKQPDSIGLVFSLTHVNSAKLLKRAAHNILFFESQFNEPFLQERIETMDSGMPQNLAQNVEFKSLQDIYQALQQDCQQLLSYILRYFLEDEKIHELKFNDLMEYSQSNFICRRQITVKAYLGELYDHKIIEPGSTDFRTIKNLVDLEVIKNFIASLDNTEYEQ